MCDRPVGHAMSAGSDLAAVCDMSAVPLGYTELGERWYERILCNHWLVPGSMGAGKSSIPWGLLYFLAPAIRDGLVEVYGIDPRAAWNSPNVPPPSGNS